MKVTVDLSEGGMLSENSEMIHLKWDGENFVTAEVMLKKTKTKQTNKKQRQNVISKWTKAEESCLWTCPKEILKDNLQTKEKSYLVKTQLYTKERRNGKHED
jgi:hypothetical protein